MKRHLTPGRIAGYLLYLSVACTLVCGVTFARYSTVVTGAGAARVAAVEMNMNTTLDLSGQLQGLAPGGEKTVSFEVTNFQGDLVSDVDQAYSITVATTGNLPLSFALSHEDAAGAQGSYAKSAPLTAPPFVWEGGALPHAGAVTHTYVLTVSWPGDQAAGRYADEIDLVTLRVDAKQAEPHDAAG